MLHLYYCYYFHCSFAMTDVTIILHVTRSIFCTKINIKYIAGNRHNLINPYKTYLKSQYFLIIDSFMGYMSINIFKLLGM